MKIIDMILYTVKYHLSATNFQIDIIFNFSKNGIIFFSNDLMASFTKQEQRIYVFNNLINLNLMPIGFKIYFFIIGHHIKIYRKKKNFFVGLRFIVTRRTTEASKRTFIRMH